MRGAGFLTITNGDEDEELDVENDVCIYGEKQYDEKDLILTSADSKEEEEERNRLRELTIGPSETSNSESDDVQNQGDDVEDRNTSCDDSEIEKTDFNAQFEKLKKDNEKLQQSVNICNVCMDVYTIPVVSIGCWHVHCEECWLRALGAKKLCPQCKVITKPQDLRKIYL